MVPDTGREAERVRPPVRVADKGRELEPDRGREAPLEGRDESEIAYHETRPLDEGREVRSAVVGREAEW